MPQVFGHKYQLFVGQPSQLVEVHTQPNATAGSPAAGAKVPSDERLFSSVTGGYIDYTTIPSDVVMIENPIQMDASVKQSSGRSNGNTPSANIKLYNLSQSTLNRIVGNAAVVLRAGFDTDVELPLIFVGQVERVFTNRVGADNVTTLLCKEASNPLKNVIFNKSFPENQTYNFILLQIIKAFQDNGVPLGGFEESDRSIQSITEASAYNNKVGKVLSEVCDEIDYLWFISKGRLYVQPRELDRPTEFVTIAPQNVIGTIRPNDDKTALAAKDKNSKASGIKVDTFLNGEVGLNTYIKISEGAFEGDYKPDSIEHKLNWYSGPWQTSIQSQRIKEFATNTI
tara:strand:- start:25729 stop:26751 length:1023 start_codon:yes stop_codon:yes gene_type:complete